MLPPRQPAALLPSLVRLVAWLVATFALSTFAGSARAAEPPKGRVVVSYWEKWTSSERDAMQAVVDDFNA